MFTRTANRFDLATLLACLLLVAFLLQAPVPTQAAEEQPDPGQRGAIIYDDPQYLQAIQRTADMVWDPQAIDLAAAHGLNILNVTWEDTGRYKNSAVGPNISDVTIQVQHRDPDSGEYQLSLMPVIRYPNFSDLTADISPDDFYLLVGNEHDQALEKVSLTEYLRNFRGYLSDPNSWAGWRTSLLAPRDTHVLVSAQAAFLPVPQQGQAEFNPVIFNYQSYQGDPAVLVIIATREGTSATIIDNVRDGFPAGFSWGQRLFFNQNGERASFTGERLSDYSGRGEADTRPQSGAAGESGLNMVLVIQVPLKQKQPLRSLYDGVVEEAEMAAPMAAGQSDVEAAVIGHGPVEGPFTEIDGLAIERDPQFPIRVTVQFYQATSNGVVSAEDLQTIADQIERVYADGEYVGSLVVSGDTGRPTEYDGPKVEPPGWWQAFWQRFEDNVGISRPDALKLWEQLRMKAWEWGLVPR